MAAGQSDAAFRSFIQIFIATCAQIVDERIHRVYVVDRDEEPRVQAVITPTDILRWAAALRCVALACAGAVLCCAADSADGHYTTSAAGHQTALSLFLHAGWWPACFSGLPAAGCPRLLSMTL